MLSMAERGKAAPSAALLAKLAAALACDMDDLHAG
jgi:transcriptional regulator with XRE-family HTH domain